MKYSIIESNLETATLGSLLPGSPFCFINHEEPAVFIRGQGDTEGEVTITKLDCGGQLTESGGTKIYPLKTKNMTFAYHYER